MTVDYGRVLKRAVNITWQHKVLWVFGVAAAFFGAKGGSDGRGGGGSPGLQYVLSGADFDRWGLTPWFQRIPFGPEKWRYSGAFLDWESLVPVGLGLLAVIAVIGLLALVVSVIVRYTSLGALVGMVDEVEETEETSFKSGLSKGWPRMLRLFAINLIIGVAVFVAVFVLVLLFFICVAIAVVPGVALATAGAAARVLGILWVVAAGLGLLLLLVLASLALAALVTLVREFSFRACVLGGEGVFDALGAGIALIRSRLREATLMWLLLLGINLALGLLAVPLALVGVGALAVPTWIIYSVTRSVAAAAVVGVPTLVLTIAMGLLIGGVYVTFRSAVWTLTYRELRGSEMLVEAA